MIRIKPLERRMVPQFVLVHLSCFKETYWGIYSEEVFEVREQKKTERMEHIMKRIEVPSNYFYYALYDDFTIIGILIFSIIKGVGVLDAIYLKKNYQRRGYGTSMIREMEKVFQSHGVWEYSVFVSSLISANDFFVKKHGVFRVEDEISIHGKDYMEKEYVVKVGDNLE